MYSDQSNGAALRGSMYNSSKHEIQRASGEKEILMPAMKEATLHYWVCTLYPRFTYLGHTIESDPTHIIERGNATYFWVHWLCYTLSTSHIIGYFAVICSSKQYIVLYCNSFHLVTEHSKARQYSTAKARLYGSKNIFGKQALSYAGLRYITHQTLLLHTL